jgi:hypothetical protein
MRLFHMHIPKHIWWLAGMWADHDHLYTHELISSRVKQAGFKIKKTSSVVRYCWPASHFLLYGLGKNIVERIGVKEFDRFQFENKPFSKLLASLMAFPSSLEREESDASVNICLLAVKK